MTRYFWGFAEHVKKWSVGATIGRPQILHCKICSPQGENIHDFLSDGPKIPDFRRAINDRPYNLNRRKTFF